MQGEPSAALAACHHVRWVCIAQPAFHPQSSHGNTMKQFMDIFSLPEMTLLSCVNEHFLKNNIDYEPVHLYKDVKVRAEGRSSGGTSLGSPASVIDCGHHKATGLLQNNQDSMLYHRWCLPGPGL